MALGQKIRYFRKRSKLSQLKLEVEIGASSGTISRIEGGDINPTKETLLKLSKVLGLSNWEYRYLTGDIATPPSKSEVVDAQTDVQDYFRRYGVLAYLVDDRSRVWLISNGFTKLLGISKEEVQKLMGESIISMVVDEDLGIRKLLSKNNYEELLRNLLLRTYREMGFMVGDKCYEELMECINKSHLARRLWKEVSSSPLLNVYDLKRRKITFSVKGKDVRMTYAVEPLLSNERFRIIEYKPTEQVYEIIR